MILGRSCRQPGMGQMLGEKHCHADWKTRRNGLNSMHHVPWLHCCYVSISFMYRDCGKSKSRVPRVRSAKPYILPLLDSQEILACKWDRHVVCACLCWCLKFIESRLPKLFLFSFPSLAVYSVHVVFQNTLVCDGISKNRCSKFQKGCPSSMQKPLHCHSLVCWSFPQTDWPRTGVSQLRPVQQRVWSR